jgi:hypothetical protein
MKLTPTQIDQLYTFTKQHYVEYYDLQTELVDHLANAIELEWESNPTLSFETLLNKEFKKFGVFGFMDVVEEKQKAMNKKYNNWVWNHFKEFFKLPKIIGTVLLIAALFYFFKFNDHNIKIIKNLFFIQFLVVFYVFVKQAFLINKKELKQKKWLLEKIIYSCGNFGGLFSLPTTIGTNISNNISYATNSFALLGMSFFLVASGLFFYIILFEIPSKAQEYLEKTYPEYKVSNQ